MSMQIIEKSGEGLSRVYGVVVPLKDLAERLEARIAEITPKMTLKGFRPGKVPAAHVRRVHGRELMGEVVQQALDESSQKALDDNKIRPAAQPDLKLESDIDQVLAGRADLAFELQVEMMPDFTPLDPATISLTRPVYQPADAEVDEALGELAAQNRTYETRTGKAVKARDGDMVVADFIGRIDGVAFEGGTASDSQIVIGSGQFIPGFEEQLIGAAVDKTVTVKVSFPDDYGVDTLKGKAAEFEVTIKDIRAPAETALDDAFAEKLGLKDMETLRAAVRSQIEDRYASHSRFKLKRALLDVLDSGHVFPLPPRMVETEFQGIWNQIEADKTQGALSPEDEGKSDEQLHAEYRKIAERRVRLGLVLAEIGRANNVAVTEQEMAQAARTEALRYGQQAQQVFDYFMKDPQAQAQLRAPLYEDKVVDLLFGLAKVKDKPVSKDDLLKDDEMPEGYGDDDAKPAKAKSAKAKAPKDEAPAADAPAKAPAKAKAAVKPAAESEAKPAKAPAKPKAKKAD